MLVCASVKTFTPVLPHTYDLGMWVCFCDALDTCVATYIWCEYASVRFWCPSRVVTHTSCWCIVCVFLWRPQYLCCHVYMICYHVIWCMQVCMCCPSCVASHTPCSCIVCIFMWRLRRLCCHVCMMCYHVFMMYASMLLYCPSWVDTHTPCSCVMWDVLHAYVAIYLWYVRKNERVEKEITTINISPRVIRKATIIMISVYEYTFVFTFCYCVMFWSS